jgi:hypothetical protein
LVEAHAVLERLAAKGPMPDWALAYAAQIALRQNDPKTAAAHLEDLFARGVTTPDGRLTLTKTLLDLDEHDRAMFHAKALVSGKELTPRERMFLAQLLLRLEDPTTAIQVGLQAYRDAPNDAEINRAFSSIVLLSKSQPVEIDQMGASAHVVLRSEDGTTLEYLVFADSAALKLAKELSLDEAQRAGLLGLRVGDLFVQDKGAWFEKRWRVEQIQSAIKYLVGDIVGHYGARFPSESFFAKGFHFDTEKPSIGDFQPLITSTHERGRRQDELLTLYCDQCLPLAPIAKLAGVSTPVLISALSSLDSGRPFYVEWSDSEGRLASRAAARLNGTTVLTRSALFTAQAFDLLPFLLQERRCIAPRSLREEIRAELSEAQEHVKEGWRVIAASERGLALQGLDAGDPILVARLDSIRAIWDWVDANVTFFPRPLETFSDSRMRGAGMRDHLGESSNDALELSLFTPAALYADDLGLRRLSNGLGITSFSTVSLIQVLAEVGAVVAAGRDRLLVSLAERHYTVIDVSPEVLIEALAPGRLLQTTREAFSLLVAPSLDCPTAARTLVRAVRAGALQVVKTTTAQQIIRYGLEAMSRRFSPATIAQVISRVADSELALLPNELRVVKTACVQFLKSRIQGT